MTRSKKRGVSLTELLVVTFIVIIVISISVQLFISLNQDYKVLTSYLGSYLKGREVIDIISKDCRIAIRVMDSLGSYVTGDNSLVLKVPSIDSSRNIIDINKEFDYIIYQMKGQDLWKTVIPGTKSARQACNSVLKKSVESLLLAKDGVSFSNITHKSSIAHLTIWVSIVETYMGKDYRVNPGTTVKLMNYEWEYVR